MRLFPKLAGAWLAIAALGSCSGGGQSARIEFEVAVDPGDATCGSAAGGAASPLQEAPCATVRLFRQSVGGNLTPILLFDPDGSHRDEDGVLERRVLLDGARRLLAFDVRRSAVEGESEEPPLFTLVFRAYSGLEPSHGATIENVRLSDLLSGGGGNELRVRLYPFQQWACAGRDSSGGVAARRALHQAVPLPNGNVMLLGGVRGNEISTTSISDGAGAALAPEIAVYDASAHEFFVIQNAELPRVGFGVRFARTNSDGTYVIQVIGGYTMPEDQIGATAVVFDESATFAPSGVPWVSSLDAQLADEVEITYDPRTRSATVSPLPESAPRPAGALNVVSDTIEVPVDPGGGSLAPTAAVLIGFAGVFQGAGADVTVSPDYYFLGGSPVVGQDEMSTNTVAAMLANPRLGATVTALPNSAQFLVWGGSVNERNAPSITGAAGELLSLAEEDTAIESVRDIPEPVAFHTATLIPAESSASSEYVVVAGGYAVSPTSGFIEASPTGPSIFALQVQGTRVSPVLICSNEDECGFPPVAMHTATWIPGRGVLLAGGAETRLVEMQPTRLNPVAQVGFVSPDFSGYTRFSSALSQPRFGHTTTLLSGNRVLVVGGLTNVDDTNRRRTVEQAEVLYLDAAPDRLLAGNCQDTNSVPQDLDAGTATGFDGGAPLPPDAGPADAGIPDGATPDVSPSDGAVEADGAAVGSDGG